MAIQPIKLYGGTLGPNPFKLTIIMDVLEVPHEDVLIPFSDVKGPAYEAINPNGRLPSIYDPNTDITLWESGAIIEYLIERYDTAEPRKLSFVPRSPEAEHARQWLYLQATGQGPYYGQAWWFLNYHPEKVPSAVERYVNEAKRLTGVLEKWLAKQKDEHASGLGDGPWLVGNKMSYADLAFIPWQRGAHTAFIDHGFDLEKFPNVVDWFSRMTSHPIVKKTMDREAEKMAEIKAAQKK
jgi:glutathione S-transferase